MIDINATDFHEKFDITKATVGVVGHGYVGKAVEHFFARKCRVLVHDKAKSELQTLAQVVQEAEVIFVAVPTPMRPTGQCYTGIVEEVIAAIKQTAFEVKRNMDTFAVVMKSTVPPGFTEEMHDKHPGMRLCFSPEFLTEANSIQDFEKTNRVIIGGDAEDVGVVARYFYGVIPERIDNNMTAVMGCHPTVAEMTKLYTNGILMTKVVFSNEMFKMCEKLGIDYAEVRFLACLDPRVGASHTLVPGPDGHLGAGGHCFPKDINNLRFVAKELGVPERLFTAVIERNNELRENKDWEAMKGRAVTEE